MIAVRDHLDRSGDALPVVITFTDDPTRLAAYQAHLAIDFPVLADTDRVLYSVLGATRGSLRRVWSPGTVLMYARDSSVEVATPSGRPRTPDSWAPMPSSTATAACADSGYRRHPTRGHPSGTSTPRCGTSDVDLWGLTSPGGGDHPALQVRIRRHRGEPMRRDGT